MIYGFFLYFYFGVKNLFEPEVPETFRPVISGTSGYEEK